MIFSEKRLRRLAGLDATITTVAIVEAISDLGFEVEELRPFYPVRGVRFGQILSTRPNPNATNLTVCQVRFAGCERIIQTAAPNVRPGAYVVAFVPGAQLGEQVIAAKTLAGLPSEGMLASLAELGFSPALLRPAWTKEILLVPPVALELDPVRELDLEDRLIEVSILPNRAEAQSYYVLARELAAYFATKFTFFRGRSKPPGLKATAQLVSDGATRLYGVQVRPGRRFSLPLWARLLLLKAEIASVDEWQDYAAFMMLEVGVYPQLVALDNVAAPAAFTISHEALTSQLVHQGMPVGLLGLETKTAFAPQATTGELLFCFSQLEPSVAQRNVKHSMLEPIIKNYRRRPTAVGLIILAQEMLGRDFPEVSPLINGPLPEPQQIDFDKQVLNNYAGHNLTQEPLYQKARQNLRRLGFNFGINNTVTVPFYRHDLSTMQDLVEEIFRFYGLNNFMPQAPRLCPDITTPPRRPYELMLTAMGYTQVWTYTLINRLQNDFNPFGFAQDYNLQTFISEERNAIRNSLARPLHEVYQYNLKRKTPPVALFDLGLINDRLALIIASDVKTYSEIKADIQRLTNREFEIRPLDNPHLHPHYNAGLFVADQQIGWIGKFNPFYLESNLIFAEVLFDAIAQPVNRFAEYDSAPLKERDLTLALLAEQSPAAALLQFRALLGADLFAIQPLGAPFAKDDKLHWSYRFKLTAAGAEKFDQEGSALVNSCYKTPKS